MSVNRSIDYGIVNNAGITEFGPVIEMNENDLARIMQVNVWGILKVSRVELPLLIESKGRIVNIGSISGIITEQFGGAYSISKHAVEALSDSLALDLAKFEIKVSIVEPGNFKSSMFKNNAAWIRNRIEAIENSKFENEMKMVLGNLENMIKMQESLPEPIIVGEAVFDSLFAENPKKRYLVANKEQTSHTIMHIIQELVQLNEDHENSYTKEELVTLIMQN